MHIIHGTWIPDDAQEFIQSGEFYVWVETDGLSGVVRQHVHPRHLASSALATFLAEKLGLRESVPGTSVRALCDKYFLLPLKPPVIPGAGSSVNDRRQW